MKGASAHWWRILIPTLFLILALLRPTRRPAPIIKTNEGYVQGLSLKSRNGTHYLAFYGIPYAKPPLGRLRFLPPQKPLPWDGILDATKVTPNCLQFDGMVFQQVLGSEDCLHINVFTPNTSSSAPVILFIPGGAFMSGGASYYNPEYFMDHHVVLVTFNYRLGPVGFLNLGVPQVSGNQGLKDQAQAIRWVHRNIRFFGGDPNRVTLFGQSAGASSVHFHILANNRFFQRAVMQSGSAFCPWSFTTKGTSPSLAYVAKLNCPKNSTHQLVRCLNNYDGGKLASYQLSMTRLDLVKDMLLPSVENSPYGYIREHPMRTKVTRSIPLITLVNSGEGSFRTARLDAVPDASVEKFRTNWSDSLSKFVAFDKFDKTIAGAVWKRYFGGDSSFKDERKFKKTLTNIGSVSGVYEQVDRVGSIGGSRIIYSGIYNYTPSFLPSFYSFYRAVGSQSRWFPGYLKVYLTTFIDLVYRIVFYPAPYEYGISHGDDLFMLWNINGESAPLMTTEDIHFSKLFVQFIVNHATASDHDLMTVAHSPKYLLFDNTAKVKSIPGNPYQNEINFWRRIGIVNFN